MIMTAPRKDEPIDRYSRQVHSATVEAVYRLVPDEFIDRYTIRRVLAAHRLFLAQEIAADES